MIYRFGVFEFDSGTGALRRNGQVHALEPQPARALARLLRTPGEIVTREQLREAVWDAGTNVDFDRGLAYCLSQIRTALGDSASNPRFVETAPKRGYRFIAPVSLAEPTTPAREPKRRPPWKPLAAAAALLLAGAVTWAAWPAKRIIVAVSIFDNETGFAEHDRLIASLSDVVVMRLAALAPERIAVNGNAAVLRRPRNIRDLSAIKESVQADFVVLGQLQREGTGLRFVTHFIRLEDDTHLKANRIGLPDGDLSRLEEAVPAEFERAVRQFAMP